jgi:esterase/lipase
MSKKITTSVQSEGVEAVLYPGDGRKDKVMIVMSGSNGGMTLTKQEAEFYHKNGIPALALALFKTKQTPKELSRVPVEYVEKAIGWLKKLGYKQVGIDGTSKGSEMALVAASLFPELSCVIVRVPSHFVSEGLAGSGKNKTPSGTSCWSYRGRELPYAPYRSRSFHILQMLMREKEMHIITFNRDKDITPETLIPIENIKAPIFMLSSKHDEVWPSYESAVYMERKLNEIGFPYPHKHIAYEHISHAVITRLPLIYKMAFKSERQHPKDCAKDREALKKELLDWVNSDWQQEQER